MENRFNKRISMENNTPKYCNKNTVFDGLVPSVSDKPVNIYPVLIVI